MQIGKSPLYPTNKNLHKSTDHLKHIESVHISIQTRIITVSLIYIKAWQHKHIDFFQLL